MNKIYFPNLNGIRFFAAFLVVVHHIEQLKGLYRLPNMCHNKTFEIIGGLGVTLFFVLSGFLITYLLFAEKDLLGTIDVKSFYVRRILRIWPLYFLIVILSFFLLPQIQQLNFPVYSQSLPKEFANKLLLFIVFLPNVAMLIYPPVPFASQAWSIGVEEQFYLLWPLLMKFFRNSLLVLFSVIIFYWFMEILLYTILWYEKDGSFHDKAIFLKNFLEYTRINCMAIGGIGSYIVFKKKSFLIYLYSRATQIIVWISLLLLTIFAVNIPYVNNEVYSILFLVIILNLATNSKSIISFNNDFFEYLGKISYGIYMYHPLAIVITIVVFMGLKSKTQFELYHNFLIYSASILITILFSSVSYEFFEKSFIRKKIKFSNIISGENTKEK